MDQQKFAVHLDHSLQLLIDLSAQYCYNSITDTYQFVIVPSNREAHSGLDLSEARHLIAMNGCADRLLSKQEAIELLCNNEKVPLSINITVYESKPDLTIIHLLCSRRLRHGNEFSDKTVKYPPFNVQVLLPPNFSLNGKNEKFDINWKKEADSRKKTGLLTKIKGLFQK
jgi:hypothetical protein